MSEPIISDASNNIVTDVQSQSQTSGFIVVYEIEVSDSNIGGPGIDRLYFHDGASGTDDITWFTPKDSVNGFGSTNKRDYMQVSYSAFPVESDGWEVRGTGSLPRPTVRFANINQYWNAYLSDYDDLVGAKVTRRRTLEKYLTSNPPIEFNKEVFYIERKVSETPIMVEFELSSAFDVQGIKLPRRTIVAARCPWKYKDTAQGGCNWPVDSRPDSSLVAGMNGTTPLYFDKDDTRIPAKTGSESALNTPSSTGFTTWGRLDLATTNSSRDGLYRNDIDYAVGNYVEYFRPMGSMFPLWRIERTSANTVKLYFQNSTERDDFSTSEGENRVVIKGSTTAAADHKSIPLKVTGVDTSADLGGSLTVQTDDSFTSDLNGTVTAGSFVAGTQYMIKSVGTTDFTAIGADANTVGQLFVATAAGSGNGTAAAPVAYAQVTRTTLYRCITAHTILQVDSADDLILPTNISYWEFGDVCGKRLNSCAIRYGHNTTTKGTITRISPNTANDGVYFGQGNGYSSAPTVTITRHADDSTGSGAEATAVVTNGRIKTYTIDNAGQNYTHAPTVTLSGGNPTTPAAAVAIVSGTAINTKNVPLPFGGFPGASLY